MLRSFIASLFLLLSFNEQPCIELQVRYMGNMGVLISGESSSVLIDGMHKEYDKNSYLFPPQELVDRLTTNDSKEYAPIKAVMASHYHRDHLSGPQVASFLEKNADAIFLGSQQSSDEVLKANKGLDKQITTIRTSSYTKQVIKKDDLTITGFYMNHTGGSRRADVQNVGFIIEMNDKKILHMGDSNWYPEMFEELNLQEEDIFIAILPYWMLLDNDSPANLEKWVSPQFLIATHISPTNNGRTLNRLKEVFPKALALTELESAEFFGE